MKLIYKGSVKDLYEDQGSIIFDYSDRYSIFDWGEMPDHIKQKGQSLAKMHRDLFQLVSDHGIKTHNCLRQDPIFGHQVRVQPCQRFQAQFSPSEKRFNYLKPEYSKGLVALPLEVVFRFGVVEGSAFIKRAQSGSILRSLGYNEQESSVIQTQAETISTQKTNNHYEVNGSMLPKPCVEYFTKLEPQDRWLDFHEAGLISQLSQEQLMALSERTIVVAKILASYFKKAGLVLWDGKLEWALNPETKEFVLIDSIGPDEMRLTFESIHLSKELLRNFYKKTIWFEAIKNAKNLADQKQDPNWKSYLPTDLKPEALPQAWLDFMTKMYLQISNLTSSTPDDFKSLISELKELP